MRISIRIRIESFGDLNNNEMFRKVIMKVEKMNYHNKSG